MQGFFQAHHQRHRRAVRQLRRVAGGDRAVFGKHRLQSGEAVIGGVRAVAVVAIDDAVEDLHLAAVLVLDPVLDRHRHNFVIEQPGRLSLGGAQLALQRIAILRLATHVITTRHHFSGLPMV